MADEPSQQGQVGYLDATAELLLTTALFFVVAIVPLTFLETAGLWDLPGRTAGILAFVLASGHVWTGRRPRRLARFVLAAFVVWILGQFAGFFVALSIGGFSTGSIEVLLFELAIWSGSVLGAFYLVYWTDRPATAVPSDVYGNLVAVVVTVFVGLGVFVQSLTLCADPGRCEPTATETAGVFGGLGLVLLGVGYGGYVFWKTSR